MRSFDAYSQTLISDRTATVVERPTRTIVSLRPPSIAEERCEPTRRMTRGATLVAVAGRERTAREDVSLLLFSVVLGATAGLGFCAGLLF